MVFISVIGIPNHVISQADPYDDYAIQQEEIERAYSILLTAKAENLVGSKQGQCVVAVRKFLGVGKDEIQGMAKNTKVNSQTPEVGAIIIMKMSRYGHVGVVLFTTKTHAVYYDSNGNWTQRAAIQKIALNDKRIKGYRLID